MRKIGAPRESEYAIGAVMEGSPLRRVIDPDAVRHARATDAYIEAETKRQLDIIARQRPLYLAGRKPMELAGRDVVVADDGVATGSTVRVALQGLRAAGPASILLAVPVGPHDAVAGLAEEFDGVVCLREPVEFRSVGDFYADFTQVTDAEVVEALNVPENAASKPG